MPTYEYKCKACGFCFDAQCPVDERNEPKKCPECGSNDSEKQISGVSLNRQREYVPIDTSQRRGKRR